MAILLSDMSLTTSTISEIETLLAEKFVPQHLAIVDDSAKHIGHKGAESGGGHYKVIITSSLFKGKSLIERHRMVYQVLQPLLNKQIHALQIDAKDT